MTELSEIKTTSKKFDIVHPGTGENLGVRVELVSYEDERMKAVRRAIIDERLRKEQRNKSMKAEELEENQQSLMARAMLGWEWYNPTGNEGEKGFDPDKRPSFHGDENPPFNPKTIKQVFKELPWFLSQLDEFVGDEKAFFA